jgi:hypothetical protein
MGMGDGRRTRWTATFGVVGRWMGGYLLYD